MERSQHWLAVASITAGMLVPVGASSAEQTQQPTEAPAMLSGHEAYIPTTDDLDERIRRLGRIPTGDTSQPDQHHRFKRRQTRLSV